METYEITRNFVLFVLVILISISVIANIRAGLSIGEKVILALISAMIAVYTFVL